MSENPRFQMIKQGAIQIVFLDYSHCNRDEASALNRAWDIYVLGQQPHSVRLLVNVEGAAYDAELTNQWKQNGVEYTKKIERCALYGMSMLSRMALEGIRKTATFFDRPIPEDLGVIFASKDEALKWLSQP